MTKAELKDKLQEINRQLRMERDSGNDSLTGQILKVNDLLRQVSKLKKEEVSDFARQWNIE